MRRSRNSKNEEKDKSLLDDLQSKGDLKSKIFNFNT
jgi:hypothetical protein